MVPVRTLSKASSVKRIKTIRLGYVLDAATFDVMDIMVLMVFSLRFCAFEQHLIEGTKFKGERSLEKITPISFKYLQAIRNNYIISHERNIIEMVESKLLFVNLHKKIKYQRFVVIKYFKLR